MAMPNGKSHQNKVLTLSSTTDNCQSINQSLWKSVRVYAVVLRQLWWQTQRYGTILGIILLTLGSLIFLCIHWSYCKLLPNFTHRVFDTNEWRISRSE